MFRKCSIRGGVVRAILRHVGANRAVRWTRPPAASSANETSARHETNPPSRRPPVRRSRLFSRPRIGRRRPRRRRLRNLHEHGDDRNLLRDERMAGRHLDAGLPARCPLVAFDQRVPSRERGSRGRRRSRFRAAQVVGPVRRSRVGRRGGRRRRRRNLRLVEGRCLFRRRQRPRRLGRGILRRHRARRRPRRGAVCRRPRPFRSGDSRRRIVARRVECTRRLEIPQARLCVRSGIRLGFGRNVRLVGTVHGSRRLDRLRIRSPRRRSGLRRFDESPGVRAGIGSAAPGLGRRRLRRRRRPRSFRLDRCGRRRRGRTARCVRTALVRKHECVLRDKRSRVVRFHARKGDGRRHLPDQPRPGNDLSDERHRFLPARSAVRHRGRLERGRLVPFLRLGRFRRVGKAFRLLGREPGRRWRRFLGTGRARSGMDPRNAASGRGRLLRRGRRLATADSREGRKRRNRRILPFAPRDADRPRRVPATAPPPVLHAGNRLHERPVRVCGRRTRLRRGLRRRHPVLGRPLAPSRRSALRRRTRRAPVLRHRERRERPNRSRRRTRRRRPAQRSPRRPRRSLGRSAGARIPAAPLGAARPPIGHPARRHRPRTRLRPLHALLRAVAPAFRSRRGALRLRFLLPARHARTAAHVLLPFRRHVRLRLHAGNRARRPAALRPAFRHERARRRLRRHLRNRGRDGGVRRTHAVDGLRPPPPRRLRARFRRFRRRRLRLRNGRGTRRHETRVRRLPRLARTAPRRADLRLPLVPFGRSGLRRSRHLPSPRPVRFQRDRHDRKRRPHRRLLRRPRTFVRHLAGRGRRLDRRDDDRHRIPRPLVGNRQRKR